MNKMTFNDENIDINVEANYNDYIKIFSKDGKKEIYFNFNQKQLDLKNMTINEKLDIVKYLNWDTSIQTEKTYYLFDLSKDKIYLTKIDENKYMLDVDIENPDMIYCPLGSNESFKKLKINAELSFEK